MGKEEKVQLEIQQETIEKILDFKIILLLLLNLSIIQLERSLHGIEPFVVANFPSKNYTDLSLSSKENADLRPFFSCHVQHCPICRISLREIHERKWFMQPTFSSAIRSQYSTLSVNRNCCHRLSSGHTHSSRSQDPITDPSRRPVVNQRVAKKQV